MREITENEFEELYKPEFNQVLLKTKLEDTEPEDMCSFSGCMYETFGPELEYVLSKVKDKRVVTILEGETDEGEMVLFYTSGYHLINRIGFLILDKPYTEDFEVRLDW